MQQIIMLKGLPGSSKSSYAKQLCIDYPEYVRISKDDIRAGYFPNYKQKNEKMVIEIETKLAVEAIQAGRSPIIDSTNLNPVHYERFKRLADQFCIPLIVDDSFLSVPLEECIERDSKREKPVGAVAIKEMFYKWLAPKYQHTSGLPWCIISDLDGSLAIKGDRDIFDDTKLHLDTINQPVYEVFKDMKIDFKFIMSGRKETCRKETEKWLNAHNIEYDAIFMRKEGDNRCDSIVKWELFNENIVDNFNVLFVIDDRMRVCKMWYEKGVFVLNVNQGLIEF